MRVRQLSKDIAASFVVAKEANYVTTGPDMTPINIAVPGNSPDSKAAS